MNKPNPRPWLQWYKTVAWYRIRAVQLRSNPLCRFCSDAGRVTAATTCDHVIPHRGDKNLFFKGPFQSLCASCHSSVKQKMESRGVEIGCDESGIVKGWQ